MKLKKWVCALLVFCMVLAVMPVMSIRALEVPKNTITSDWLEIPFQVNPRYEGFVDPGEFEDVAAERVRNAVLPADNIKFLSKDEAAAVIRENMKNRVTSFNVNLAASGYSSAVAQELIEKAVAHTGKPDEGDSLAWQFAGYSAGVKVQDGGVTYYFEMVYYTTPQQEAEMDRAVANLLSRLNLKNKSDYEKVRGVYDYVCKNVTYDHKNLNDNSYTLKFTPYAALINKTAVCQGYALLMYRLLLELGVDNRLIAGIGGNEAHGWNIVKLDGLYYNLDSTWDAGMDEYAFFLVSRKNFPYHFRYLDYETFAFHKAYPMAEANYKKGTTAKLDPIILDAYISENISFSLNRNGTLAISGTGAMPDFDNVDYNGGVIAPWRCWENDITKIVVNKGVTEIGECAFYRMKKVQTLSLPAGLITIGGYAFSDCTSLTALNIPNGMKTIETRAFENCKALTELRVPESVTSLSGFYYCTGLKKVYLYNSGIIDGSAFEKCTALKEVVISGQVETIGAFAFSGCRSLETVTIPESVTLVAREAFGECTGLTTVYLKNSGVLEAWAFNGCVKLKNVHFLGNITEIKSYAFDECEALVEITLPASLEKIGQEVFSDCVNLKTVCFTGDAPEFDMRSLAFRDLTLTAYYPIYNETWTPGVLQDYGGKVTWIGTCYDNHIYDEGVVTLAPTCTEKGVMTYSCVNCDKTRTEPIPATGHTSGSSDVEVEPTCMTLGVMEHVCAVCNGTYVTDIPRLPHTCENGICTACGNSIFRMAGANRWATALKVADEMRVNLAVEKFDAIIIASGNDFADALAGSYLSTVKNAPILLAWGRGGKYEYLDTDNIAYIQENLVEGGTVYILGGVNAVPELYETSLAGFTVKRLGGANRFETNLLILAEAGVAEGSEVLVCTSTNFADSLSASATAKPILLVFNELGQLYGAQPDFLAGLTNCTFTVIGGENAVGTALAEAIGAYGAVERLAGANRFETSVLVAQKYFQAPEYAVLAYAWNYPDGLCGGALAYTLKAPLILTMTKYEDQAAGYIQTGAIGKANVLGGESLISDDSIRTIFQLSPDRPIAVKDQIAQPVVDTPDDGTPDDGTPDDGTTGDGTPDDGTTGDGTPDDGTTGDGTPDDGTTGDGTPDDGTTGDGTTDDGTPDDGTTGDGTPDDGTTDDGTTDDDTPTEEIPVPENAEMFWFFHYNSSEFVKSDVAAYQAVTGVPCYMSGDRWDNYVEGYVEESAVFVYEYDSAGKELYIRYLESLGFTLYATRDYNGGNSFIYHHEATGLYIDLVVYADQGYLTIELFAGKTPEL